MANNDLAVNSSSTIKVREGSAQIAAQKSSGKQLSIKENSVKVDSAQDIVKGVHPTKEGSIRRIESLTNELDAALSSLNNATSLNFSVDSSSNRFVVKVTEPDSGAVIFEVPNEAILRVAQNIESLKGVLFDKEM